MQVFTSITSVDYYETLQQDAGAGGETNWTINKNARSGDRVLLYVCAPVSAIVAVATLTDDAYLEDEVNSPWYGRYFADMHALEMLALPVERKALLARLPDYKYWTQPRNSVLVPPKFLPVLEQLTRVNLTS